MSSSSSSSGGGGGGGGGGASAGEASVTLISSEGEKKSVPMRVAKQSGLVKTMLDDASAGEEVPLGDVKAHVLAKVLEFCTHHVDAELPPIDKVCACGGAMLAGREFTGGRGEGREGGIGR